MREEEGYLAEVTWRIFTVVGERPSAPTYPPRPG